MEKQATRFICTTTVLLNRLLKMKPSQDEYTFTVGVGVVNFDLSGNDMQVNDLQGPEGNFCYYNDSISNLIQCLCKVQEQPIVVQFDRVITLSGLTF